MTKKALLAEAQNLGLEVTEKNTKAEIQKAISEVTEEKVVAPPKLNNIKIEPILERGDLPPVTYEEHIKAGFITPGQSEYVQKQGKRVVEIKNIGGLTLHRLEKI